MATGVMPRLPLLIGNFANGEVVEYEPGTFETDTQEERRCWGEVFRRAQPGFLARAEAYERREYGEVRGRRSAKFDTDFRADIDAFETSTPPCTGGIVSLCAARERCLRKHGLCDIFDTVKRDENERSVRCLPRLIRSLGVERQSSGSCEWEAALRGVYAGNMFDLGADTTQRMYDDDQQRRGESTTDAAGLAQMDEDTVARFLALRERMRVGCGFVKDYDKFLQKLRLGQPYRTVLFFVDNAGPDIAFGCLPLIRQFLRTGASVTGAFCNRNSFPMSARCVRVHIHAGSSYIEFLKCLFKFVATPCVLYHRRPRQSARTSFRQ